MSTLTTGEEQIHDTSSLIDDNDRAYRNRAIALINGCRLLSRVSRQRRRQYIGLRRVLEICDDALRSAARAGNELTNEANESFESAVQSLAKYELNFQSRANVINSWMKRAMRKDLFEVSSVPLPPSPMIVVDFIVFKTLPDPKPIIVQQVLRRGAELDEVLWNFSRFNDNRRITLQDNPHFYLELPTSVDAYTGEFRTLPVQDMQLISNSTIYVLVDRPSRVFLEAEEETRIFGNVYMLKDVMIFKDIHGTLEGEAMVGESILDTPNLGHYKEPFPSVFPASALLSYRHGFPPGFMINHTAEWTREDWRELIRRRLGPDDEDLYIYARREAPIPAQEMVLPPPPPTSERPEYDVLYTSADGLNSDILLTIFDHYRLNDERGWNVRRRWCELAQVCRKWRQVIYDSWSRLNIHIHIHFTLGARPLDKLAHLPPMPLVINYPSPSEYIPYPHIHRRRNFDLEDEYAHSGILHALQQYDPTRFIALKVQLKTLQKLIVPMDRHFPRLATLSLLSESQTIPKKDTTLILPRGFLAPNLRHLELCRIFLPTGLPFLTSTPFLVVLKLTNIQASGYFSPEDLVTQLGHLLQLEDLSIDFSISLPDPDEEEELLRVPLTPTRLPSLRFLEFRGVCAYLEGLVGRICAPSLERFHITLFYEPTFTLGHLSEFIEATEGIRGPFATVAFVNQDMDDMAPSFSVTSRNELRVPDSPLALKFRCDQFDWQVYSMTEVCEALVPVLSVSELSLQYYSDPGTPGPYSFFDEPHRSSDGQNAIDSIMWHELLRPFNGVRRLGVSNRLAEELSCALDADDAGLIPWLLPELQELGLNDVYPDVQTDLAAFLNARQSVGRPVNLLPPLRVYVPPPISESPVFPSPPSPRLSLPASINQSTLELS